MKNTGNILLSLALIFSLASNCYLIMEIDTKLQALEAKSKKKDYDVCGNLFALRDTFLKKRASLAKSIASTKNVKRKRLLSNWSLVLKADLFNLNKTMLFIDCIDSFEDFKQ